MVNKQHAAVAIVAVIIIVVAGFFAFGGTEIFAAKQSANEVDAAVTKDCAGTPWFVGVEKGFFNKSGIKFVDKGEIKWSDQPAAFASGQINVYDGHPVTLINLLKAGVKFKGVAVGGAEPTNGQVDEYHMHYLVLANSTLHNASDIKAREASGNKVKVAVGARGDCIDLEFNAWLRKNNLTQNDITYVVLPDPQQEQALKQGQIDVASLHPPFYKKAETDGNVRILATSWDAMGPAAGLSLLVFSDDYIAKYPGTVRDFTNAYKDAERWINNNREEAGQITAKDIGLPYTSNVHYYSSSGAIDDKVKGYLQQWIDAMVADGDIKQGQYKPEDLYTTEFSDTWKTNLPDN
ncbi:ABC transporter substrate-binding protein [Methanobacterium sp.]|uniref:ABC transporter substrate-binding protein n=1 Tax=Methanobacterium sp. TaxID=2164 RepID=UPI003C787D15